MSSICWRLLRRNAVLALATSLRYHHSAEDAPEPCYTSHSSRKLNGLLLNKCPLEVLNVTFNPQLVPKKDEDINDFKEFFRRGRVYLVGTSHGKEECAADVRRAMRHIRPDAVMIEKCTYHEEDLYDDDDDDGDNDDDEDDDDDGDNDDDEDDDDDDDYVCEFRAAVEECRDLPDCDIILGDRPHRITDKRAWNVIGAGEIWRTAKDIGRLALQGDIRRVLDALSEVFTGTFDYADDIYADVAKRRAYNVVVDSLITELFPEWWKAVMTERDLYMTHVLHDALESLTQDKFIAARYEGSSSYTGADLEPVRIVAVVGKAHLDGIKANWGKVDWVDDEVIDELWRIPPNKWIPAAASSGRLAAVVVMLYTTFMAACMASCLEIPLRPYDL